MQSNSSRLSALRRRGRHTVTRKVLPSNLPFSCQGPVRLPSYCGLSQELPGRIALALQYMLQGIASNVTSEGRGSTRVGAGQVPQQTGCGSCLPVTPQQWWLWQGDREEEQGRGLFPPLSPDDQILLHPSGLSCYLPSCHQNDLIAHTFHCKPKALCLHFKYKTFHYTSVYRNRQTVYFALYFCFLILPSSAAPIENLVCAKASINVF